MMKALLLHFFGKIRASIMLSLFGTRTVCYIKHREVFFGINVICWNSRICRDHESDVLLIQSCISLLKSHEMWFSPLMVSTNAKRHFFSPRLLFFSWKQKLL